MQRRALSFSYPAPRTLDEVVKIDLLETETPARVREIWDEYHLTKEDVVGQAWTRDEYGAFTEAAREAPMFVFPVRRDEGEFVMLSQVQEKHCILTFLDEYKLDPLAFPPRDPSRGGSHRGSPGSSSPPPAVIRLPRTA